MEMKLIVGVAEHELVHVVLKFVTELIPYMPEAFIWAGTLVLASRDDIDTMHPEFIANPGKYLDESDEREQFSVTTIVYHENDGEVEVNIITLMEKNVPMDVIVGLLKFVHDQNQLSIKNKAEFEAIHNQTGGTE
jgi:hypothetical protein